MPCCFEVSTPLRISQMKGGVGGAETTHVHESIHVPVSLSCVSFHFPFGVHLRLFWGSDVP